MVIEKNDVSSATLVYPLALRTAVLNGLYSEMRAEGKAYDLSIGTVCCEEPQFDFDEWASEQQVFDDSTGAKLPLHLVKAAMLKEIEEYRKHQNRDSRPPIAELTA